MEEQNKPRRGRPPKSFDVAGESREETTMVPPDGDIDRPDIRVERESLKSGRAEMLKFMEEPIEIEIYESPDENAERFVFCSVNGEGAGPPKFGGYLPRGVPVTVKRKHVEVLVRAKRVSVRTDEVRGHDGARSTALRRKSGQAYPFRVLRDDNPRGAAWLKHVAAA